eukprot:gnl/TRDRNA2_/TRDRNA2_144250_c1_seq1.p1 gnl/TRDRNA2_/TRDRNA2_144250_c1~~gnl/TRDRNA2_/TRDRNA2_144250_c1_seq1.p1  ORF type:complete len:123 (+),score=25.73 gnl/TRDRNA2_/TRDRNA2_144250_c1_seq1:156-524(+)
MPKVSYKIPCGGRFPEQQQPRGIKHTCLMASKVPSKCLHCIIALGAKKSALDGVERASLPLKRKALWNIVISLASMYLAELLATPESGSAEQSCVSGANSIDLGEILVLDRARDLSSTFNTY